MSRHGRRPAFAAAGAAVYLIHNRENGRVYVGGTSNIRARWSLHLSLLRRGKHANTGLQSDWHRYGPLAFEFRVLEQVTSRDELLRREMYWADSYRFACNVYNIEPVGGRGVKLACNRGHPYDDANTYTDRNGRRTCQECRRILRRARTIQLGRQPGASHAKLTPDQVRAIRARNASGETKVDLAREFGVSPSTVRRLVQRRLYANVE
jgi:group I intron endonuclease